MVMTNSNVGRPYKGVFPVVPTVFDGDGRLDLDGQKRAVDFMIDAGSHGLCILANFSEQFVLTDAERDMVLDTVLNHVAGRVPVIVTTTHFASHICAERSQRAQQAGACHGDGDAALSRCDHPGRGSRNPPVLPNRFRSHLDSHHDSGRAGSGYAAVGGLPPPPGAGARKRLLLQDRGAPSRPPPAPIYFTPRRGRPGPRRPPEGG